MRLLHTSDWHLGRSFHRVDLLDAQASYVDSLVETVRAERVDAVLVSGDVYDRALPPVDAVSLCSDALRRLVGVGARVVVISGNHDSPRRLGFGDDLLDLAGLHVRTRVARAGSPVLVEDRHGPVVIYGVPYLEPEAVGDDLGELPARSHAGVLGAALRRVRADLATRPGARSVVLAHAFVHGGATSDSERDITVGGVASVPLETFVGVDYTALGHLHGAQVLADGIRYSGSPLPYSFSEAGQVKSSWLVSLGSSGLESVERVPAPVPRPLSVLRGRLDDLLTDPGHDAVTGHFLSVVLTDPVRPVDAMARLQRRFPSAVCLEWQPDGGLDRAAASYAERVRGRGDLDVARTFVAHVRRSPATDGETRRLRTALEATRLVGVSR